MKATKEQLEKLLNLFVSKDELREWLLTPFNAGNKTIATDAYSFIAVDKIDGYTDYTDKISRVYPMQSNCKFTISFQELESKLDLCPIIELYDEVVTKCDACSGDGVVDYEFDYGHKTYEQEFDCPVCDGEGSTETKTKTGLTGKDEFAKIQIGNSLFSYRVANKLYLVAKELGCGYIEVLNQTKYNKPTLFNLNGIEIILMPILCDEYTGTFAKIILI